MSYWFLFFGCLLAMGAFVALLIHYKTFLYGFNALNAFNVGTAGLSAFIVAIVFDLPLDWYTDQHTEVITYMVLGMISMAGGVYIAWRPLRAKARSTPGLRLYVPLPSHFNRDIGWLTFVLGAIAELMLPLIGTIPTVSTAINCIATLTRIGLIILLVDALHRRQWSRFGLAMMTFAGLSIVGALTSGFSFIRINTLLPLALIWLVFSGITIKNLIGIVVLVPTAITAVTAWLDTRVIIRSGSLESLPLLDKAGEFVSEYWANLAFPSPETLLRTLLYRVDMTDILAAQAAYQPAVEPFANGGTLFSSLYTLIPRVIWPEKPEVAGGSAFVAQYTGLFRSVDDTTSVGLPYQFELFANGGALWVILGLFAVGYVCGRLELKLTAPQRSLGAFWAVALSTATLCEGGQRADVVLPALVASALSAYVLGWVAQRFLKRRNIDIMFDESQLNTRSPVPRTPAHLSAARVHR